MGLDEINFHFGAAVRRIVEGETKFRCVGVGVGWVGGGGGGAWVGWCMYGGVGWACPEQGCIVEGETKFRWGVQWSGGLWSGL